MSTSITINRRRMGIGEAKDIENAIAQEARNRAIVEYIAVCDYPELLEDEAEVEE